MTLTALPLGAELKTLGDLFRQAEQHANVAMQRDGRMMPKLFIVGSNGPHVLSVVNGPSNEQAKDDFTAVARTLCVAHRATAALIAAEAWVTVGKGSEAPDLSVPPSQSPDRREMIVLLGETRNGPQQKFLSIQRNDSGKYLGLGNFELPGVDQVAGRFAQFLATVEPSAQEQTIASTLLRLRGLESSTQHNFSARFRV